MDDENSESTEKVNVTLRDEVSQKQKDGDEANFVNGRTQDRNYGIYVRGEGVWDETTRPKRPKPEAQRADAG